MRVRSEPHPGRASAIASEGGVVSASFPGVPGVFFKLFLGFRLGLGVSRSRSEFAPSVAAEQSVHIAERDFSPGNLLQLPVQLLSGEDFAARGCLPPLFQKALFLLPLQKSPAPPATPGAMKSLRSLVVVL